MASTSLRRQVEALRHSSSGTSSGYLQRKKGRPSLLLTSDQAAAVDLSSVREAAVIGLQRLEAVDQSFSAFKATLFSKDAENTFRDLQTKETNELINKSIESFLALLSPHFSSREAHVCLEYLIRHYKIYQHNVDAVVECCLPWHDTVAFARMVQLISLKGSRWDFLIPVQQTGSPLPREAIARRCVGDHGFLRFICASARRAGAAVSDRTAGSGAYPVSTATASGTVKFFSFYAAVIVEAVSSLYSLSEALLRALIPNVVHGLSATKAPEYQMASYMILSTLSGKGPLSSEVLSAVLTSLLCKPCHGRIESPLLCAVAVAQSRPWLKLVVLNSWIRQHVLTSHLSHLSLSSNQKLKRVARASLGSFVESQAGFRKKGFLDGQPLRLPDTAFQKLSRTEALPAILASFAQKFDTHAFVWVLLQSYVQHLADQDSENSISLTRLCAYPNWPQDSLRCLIRRLSDGLMKTYLTVAHECLAPGLKGEIAEAKKQEARRRRTESEKVLRVLSQRFPREVDQEVAQLSRSLSKNKASSAAALAAADDGDDVEGDLAKKARHEAFREETLSSLLVSAFSEDGLASHLPLQRENEESASEPANETSPVPTDTMYGSVMLALEHSSAAVRARALEQLANVTSEKDISEGGGEDGAANQQVWDEDLANAVMRRLHDEDPEVVLALTGNDVLLQKVLLRPAVNDGKNQISRAADIASATCSAATPWILSLSEARPRHSVASAGQVLCGLLRFSCATVSAATPALTSKDSDTRKVAVDAASRLILECFPGPHAMARVKAARRSGSADMAPEDGDAVDGTVRARKKALRATARAAMKAVSSLDEVLISNGGVVIYSVFSGAGKELEKAVSDLSSGKSKSTKQGKEVMDVEEEGGISKKPKGLKTMGEEVCDIIARHLAARIDVGSVQDFGQACGSGARWLLLEVISRAVALLSSNPALAASDEKDAVSTAVLSSLLARLSILEISSLKRDVLTRAGLSASVADLLGYLRISAPHLPRPLRPFSLIADDHVTMMPPLAVDETERMDGGAEDEGQLRVSSLTPGDVLAAVLKASAGSHSSDGVVACQAIGAVVLHGFGGRPLVPLAAIAIEGGGRIKGRASSAAQALYVASTFLMAAAETAKSEATGAKGDRKSDVNTCDDLVAVFPAAILAVASEDKGVRDAGLLFISTVANHGDAFCPRSNSNDGPTKAHGGKSTEVFGETGLRGYSDSSILPIPDDDSNPSPLRAPPLKAIVDLARRLSMRNAESTLDRGELTRHLRIVMGDSASHRGNVDDSLRCLARYLVAWAARLGWRDVSASALLLECLVWAKLPLQECGLPLLRHLLSPESLLEEKDTGRVLKLLIGVTMSTLSPDDGDVGKKREKGRGGSRETSYRPVFTSTEAEELFHKALRTPGQAQTAALETLKETFLRAPGSSNDGAGEVALQRRRLLRALVEAGIAGADGSFVVDAATALQVRPQDIVNLLTDVSRASVEDESVQKKRGQSATPNTQDQPTSSRTVSSGWVSTFGGVVELAQAVFDSPVSTSTNLQPAVKPALITEWKGAGPLVLARPLFDIILEVLALVVGSDSNPSNAPDHTAVAAAEYALWLTMDLLQSVLKRGRRRWITGSIFEVANGTRVDPRKNYDDERAGEDAENVLKCFRENPSPQTRNSALGLLSTMATMFPRVIASQLRNVLDTVSTAASTSVGGDRVMMRQTQKAVQCILPALKEHGLEAGVGAHFVVQVFVDALSQAPINTQRSLFTTLCDSLGRRSLPIVSALLLLQAISSDRHDGDKDIARVEFVHQIMYGKDSRVQVFALVDLIQACHRLTINAAERSGNISTQTVDDTVSSFSVSVTSEHGKADYLQLPLNAGEEKKSSNAPPKPSCLFMTMDLRLVSASLSDSGKVGMFLEKLLSFVRGHLMSKRLVMAVAAAAEQGDNDAEGIQKGFLMLCEELLLLLKTLGACQQESSSSQTSGVGVGSLPWGALKSQAYSVFETMQALLSMPSFVAVTQELLQHQDPHLRRKALQMFTRRLDPGGVNAPRLTAAEEALFVEIVPSLRFVATGVKLAPPESSAAEDDEELEDVIGRSPSDDPMDADQEERGEESDVNRQTALLSLDVLARVLGRRHETSFVGVLSDVTGIVAGDGPGALPDVDKAGSEGSLALRSSAFLLVATLCAVLGVRAFPLLPRFFPAMLRALEVHSKPHSQSRFTRDGDNGLLWTSALSAVATVAASLPSFLSPYLGRILSIALHPAAAANTSGGGSSAAPAPGQAAANRVLSFLVAGVEPRLLIPAVCGGYAGCVRGLVGGLGGSDISGTAKSVSRLLAFVQEVVASLDKQDASTALPQFLRLLTQALDFRRLYASGSTAQVRASAELVETEASSALVALVLKLSEVELRPLFLHLCEWKAAVSGDGPGAKLGELDRRLSFYRVLERLASSLKSIFTPYFAHVLTNCCDDMAAASSLATALVSSSGTNIPGKRKRIKEGKSKTKRRKKDSGEPAAVTDGAGNDARDENDPGMEELWWRRSLASRLVLSALRRCFQFDRSGFVDKARFELVLPELVSQLECGADFASLSSSSEQSPESRLELGEATQDEVASCRLHAEELVGPCLAQLASASAKDVHWKALANAVLLRTRSSRTGVRVAALVSLRQCFEVIGEEFLALLPECTSFLSELLEDGHPEVEKECRSLIKYIEAALGESIDSYLV